MRKARRILAALAIPLVAIAAVAFTAHSALSSPGAAPTDQPQPNLKPNTEITVKPPKTNFTDVTKPPKTLTTKPPKTTTKAPPTTSATPSKTPTTTPTRTATTAPSGTGPAGTASAGPGGVVGAPFANCAGKQVTGPLTVKVATVRGTQALVDGDDCTLYLFTKDTEAASACDSTCEQTWPPAPGPATAGEGVQQSDLGTFDRAGGFVQATYFGKQLYYFSGDASPGEANGQGLDQAWYLVDPAGNPITQ